jgi:PAS domain S-box-containing protein
MSLSGLHSLTARLRHRSSSLRPSLIRLVVAALAPAFVFAIAMIVVLARQEKTTLVRGMMETSRALTLAVDREFESSMITLKALATSEHLDSGDLKKFYTVCTRIFQRQDNWKAIILFDANGRQLFNIAKPGGAALPALTDRETFNQAVRSGISTIGNFAGLGSAEANVNLYVPVLRQNTTKYILTAVVGPEAFAAILAQQKLPERWVGTVLDRKKVIVARTRAAEQFVGKPAGTMMANVILNDLQGFVESNDLENVPSYTAFTRSFFSGWAVALTLPAAEASALIRRSLWTVSLGGIALLLTGIFLALKSSKRISDPIKSLSHSARALARGEEPPGLPNRSWITELDSLGRDMEYAAQLLRERSRERDRVEAALREREESLQRQADLLDLADEAIFAWEMTGGIVYWNRGAEQLYQYPQSDAIGRVCDELLRTVFPQGRGEFLSRLAETTQWHGELKQSTRAGQQLVVDSHLQLITDRSGRRLVLECTRDITNRKRAEQRRATEHAVTRILAESESVSEAWSNVLRAIVERLQWNVGVLWRMAEEPHELHCVELWHGGEERFPEFEAACRRGGFSPGIGLPGRIWQNSKPAWIRDVARDGACPRSVEAADANLHGAFGFPIRMGNKVLAIMEFFRHEPLELDADLLAMADGIGSEIGQYSERKRAEEELSRSKEKLRQQAQELEQQLIASGRLVSVGELAASMAHEFNNPLGIVLGFVQDLLGKTEPTHPSYRALQIIKEEAERCEMLVRDLLEYARPRSEEFVLTDMKELVVKTLEKTSNRVQSQNVEVIESSAANLPRLRADPRQLQQVLVNLCLNALDAMPKGGKLMVGARLSGSDTMTLTVADTGFGIEADTLPKIFQPFFTAKKRRGLGLGLPVCVRIVKAHGGRIDVESQAGLGTTFKVHLPLNSVDAGSARSEEGVPLAGFRT